MCYLGFPANEPAPQRPQGPVEEVSLLNPALRRLTAIGPRFWCLFALYLIFHAFVGPLASSLGAVIPETCMLMISVLNQTRL